MHEDEYLDISSQDAVLCSVCTANLFNFSQHTREKAPYPNCCLLSLLCSTPAVSE